jgi:hypothetical protein
MGRLRGNGWATARIIRSGRLGAAVRVVPGSRKWRSIWSATYAVYYLPRLFRSLRRKVRA